MSDDDGGGKSNGAGRHVEGGANEPATGRKPPPAPVAELVAACMRFVASKYKVSLDGTPDTLSLLDQYVREAREAIEARPESLELVAPAVGAYLGEVMRDAFGAEWSLPSERSSDHAAWRLCFTHVYLAFNPIGMAREAITLRDEDGFHAHLQLDPGDADDIQQRLAAMPEVDEEEYYLPTTCFDVVHTVVETLRARAEATATADVTFTPDDYD